MSRITKTWLKKHGACQKAVEWVMSCKTTDPDVLYKIGMREKRYQELNWGLSLLLSKKNRVRYALYAAKQVQHIYATRYPNDNSVRDCICLVEKSLRTKVSKQDLENAAYAAYAATYAAANNAAAYAANAAANAANNAAAYNAANAAAYAAYTATEKERLQRRILFYGMRLLRAQ